MNNVLVVLILGMGLTGAILLKSIPPLFKSPVKSESEMIIVGSAMAFVVFAIPALVLHRGLEKVGESE